MTISELIRQLEAIRAAHGDEIIVLHHDDWTEFVVEAVTFNEVSRDLGDKPDAVPRPANVLIEGQSSFWGWEERSFVESKC